MKKTKGRLSVVEGKTVRMLLYCTIAQIVILLALAHTMYNSHPIALPDALHAEITVDAVDYRSHLRSSELVLYADGDRYYFHRHSSSAEYTLAELYHSIHEGDSLTLLYREVFTVFGEKKIILDARNDGEVYRRLDFYNDGLGYGKGFALLIFCVIELIFLLCAATYLTVNKNNTKSLYRKMERRLRR